MGMKPTGGEKPLPIQNAVNNPSEVSHWNNAANLAGTFKDSTEEPIENASAKKQFGSSPAVHQERGPRPKRKK